MSLVMIAREAARRRVVVGRHKNHYSVLAGRTGRRFSPASSALQQWQARTASCAVLALGCTISSSFFHHRSYCAEAAIAVPKEETATAVVVNHDDPSWHNATTMQKLRRAWRLVKRWFKLSFTLAPVVAFYPLLLLLKDRNSNISEEDAQVMVLHHDNDQEAVTGLLGWYLNMCLVCVEHSGAAVIKLMQWAGSRPDLFGYDFCSVFSKLQDNTTPHRWRYTETLMQEAYGENWRDKIELDDIIGSGCIGQVYKGRVKAKAATKNSDGDTDQQVAVKVLHPTVHDDIDADLDLMRVAVRVVDYLPFFSNLKWLNLQGIVEEFAGLLKLQIDLRREAANLERFQENFKNDKVIEFPHLVPGFPATEKVLVETFCEGIPVVQFCRENKDNQAQLTEMCRGAISAVCKMIFLDNFVHGDMHPGNVFVSPDGKKFILFDVGIVNEYSEEDHNIIIDVLAAFVRKQGRVAGRLMIDDSNSKLLAANSDDHALEEEKYIDKIEMLTIKASTKGYFMESLGTYISYICDAASQHHVMMNPSFISAALAVKVQEGIALAMDPSCKIPTIAIPIIIESERRRLAKDMLSFEKIKQKLSFQR